MNKKEIKQKIKSYINASYQWHEENEGTCDEGIGREMLDLEEEILTSFGLPFMAFQYSDIMQQEGFSKKNIEQRSEELIERLTKEAKIFLLAPIEKDTTILTTARRRLQDAVEVLPFIGITSTAYNCFLYYDIFFRGIYNEQEVLKVFKISEELDIQEKTRIPHTYDTLVLNNNFERLTKIGLPFLKEYKKFLKYQDLKQKWNESVDNYNLGEYFGLPDVFELKHFFVTNIYLKNEKTCCISILIEKGKLLVELSIWCAADMMRVIMLHAKYYSLAIPPLYISSPKFLIEERKINIKLKQAIGKNVEIEKIKIEIEKMDDEDDEIKDPFAYIITALEVNENIPKIYREEESDDLPF